MNAIDCLRKLRENGWTWGKIADGVGVSPSYVVNLVNSGEDKVLKLENEVKITAFYKLNSHIYFIKPFRYKSPRANSKLKNLMKIRQLFWV